MSTVGLQELVEINLGKSPASVCDQFYKFLSAFRGDVILTLEFLTQRQFYETKPIKEGPTKDLIVKVQKHLVTSIYNKLDILVAEHKLPSRAAVVERLAQNSGIDWDKEGGVKLTSHHSLHFMKKLNKDREENKFCDITILISDKGNLSEFPAHKSILTCSSDYFTDHIDATSKVIKMHGLSHSQIFSQILNFIYMGEISLNQENAAEVFKIAKLLSIRELEKQCEEYSVLTHKSLDFRADEISVEISCGDDSEKLGPVSIQPGTQPCDSVSKSDSQATEPKSSISKSTRSRRKTVQYVCQLCGKYYKSRGNLNRHMLNHTGERKHRCETCGKLFMKNDHLVRHERTHSIERPFSCEQCDKRFKSKDNLKKHLLTHSEDRPFCCEICAKTFKDKWGLIIHQRSHNKSQLVCNVCGKSFLHRNRLTCHMLQHAKPRSCEICGKSFKFQTRLQRHMKTHTGDRPFGCETCGRRFIDSHSLKSHQKKHTGIGLLACRHCNKKFVNQYHLNRHMKTHTGEKPYKCEICQKLFSRSDNCEIHKRSCAVKDAMHKDLASFQHVENGQVKMKKLQFKDICPQAKNTKTDDSREIVDKFALAVNSDDLSQQRFDRVTKKPPEMKLIFLKNGTETSSDT